MPIVDANDKSFEEVVHQDGKVHLNASSTRGGGGGGGVEVVCRTVPSTRCLEEGICWRPYVWFVSSP